MPSDLLQILGDPELQAQGIVVRKEYPANAPIIHEGDKDDRRLFLIQQGSVRVSGRVELEDHRHIQPGLTDLGVGEVFGELNLYEAHPRSATVVAVEDSVLLEMEAETLGPYLEEHPDLGYQVLKHLFQTMTCRLRKADQRLESIFAWGLKAHGIDKHL